MVWTYDLIEAQSRQRGTNAEEQLLAIFDVLHDWFTQHTDYDGCSFVKVLLEMGPSHPAGQASIGYLANLRTVIGQRASAAGLVDTDEFARSFHILIKGAIISATEGDSGAAHRAQAMARLLVERHRSQAPVDASA